MGFLDSLPTMAEVNAVRRAKPKHEIEPRMLAKERKDKAKKKSADACRNEVWKRDASKCRATGVPLVRGGTTDPKKLGEVDHTLLRSTDPDKVYDTANMLLLQKWLNRLRKVVCRNNAQFKYFDYTAVDPTDQDRAKPQRFIWRDDDGNVIKERIG